MIEFDSVPWQPFNRHRMLQSEHASGYQLRLVFFDYRDRIAHALSLVRNGIVVPIAISCEGNECDAWPASPPLQNLSMESHAGANVALLLGMAGRSHWSASVGSPSAGKFEFELACRVGMEPVQLGSSYNYNSEDWEIGLSQENEQLFQNEQVTLRWQAAVIDSVPTENLMRIPAPRPWNVKPIVWKYTLEIV